MVATKVRFSGSVLVLMALLLGGPICFWLLSSTLMRAAAPATLEAKDSSLKALLQERFATVREIMAQANKAYDNGTGSLEQVHRANLMVLNAELELCDSEKDRITVLEKIVAEARNQEKNAIRLSESGVGSASAPLMAKNDRLQAEIALERAKIKGSTRP